jgi:hypothetical protein
MGSKSSRGSDLDDRIVVHVWQKRLDIFEHRVVLTLECFDENHMTQHLKRARMIGQKENKKKDGHEQDKKGGCNLRISGLLTK